MESLAPAPQKTEQPNNVAAENLLAQKRQIRALKRLLVAKAEVRRLKSLLGRRRVTVAR